MQLKLLMNFYIFKYFYALINFGESPCNKVGYVQ